MTIKAVQSVNSSDKVRIKVEHCKVICNVYESSSRHIDKKTDLVNMNIEKSLLATSIAFPISWKSWSWQPQPTCVPDNINAVQIYKSLI